MSVIGLPWALGRLLSHSRFTVGILSYVTEIRNVDDYEQGWPIYRKETALPLFPRFTVGC